MKTEAEQVVIVKQADRVLQAKGLYGEIAQSERFNLQRAHQLGKVLAEIKEVCPHGDWLDKLKEIGIPARTAQEYMQIAKYAAPRISSFASIREALESLRETETEDGQANTSETTEETAEGGSDADTSTNDDPEREAGDETAYDNTAALAKEREEAVKEKCSAAVRRAVRTKEIDVEDAYIVRNESHVKQDKALDMVRLGKAKTLAAAVEKIKPPKKREAKVEVKDSLGNVVPDRCRDAFADPSLADLIGELEQAEALVRAEPWLGRATKLTDHYQFLLLDKFKQHAYAALESIQLALESLRSGMPYAVCPKCNAVENGKVCRTCRGGGHIPLHRYQELTSETA